MHMRMCDLVNKIPRGKKRKIVEQIIEERKRAWMDKNPEGQLDQREVVVDDGSDINTDGEDDSESDISLLNLNISEISCDEEVEIEEESALGAKKLSAIYA